MLLLLTASKVSGQLALYPAPNIARVATSATDSLLQPFVGGFQAPQFNNLNIDGDSIANLIIYDKEDGSLYYFKSVALDYKLAEPQRLVGLPPVRHWLLTRDYDGDGDFDWFTQSEKTGISLYQNNGEQGWKLVSEELDAAGPSGASRIYNSSGDLPAIQDVDGDGDLDIITFDPSFTFMNYYRNRALELYGRTDTFDFAIADFCWGKVRESAISNSIDLGIFCGEVGPVTRGARHAGSNLLLLDHDDDGDLDLWLADVSSGIPVLLENNRAATGRDSIIAIKQWPNANSLNLELFPALFSLEVLEEEGPELVATPQAGGFQSKLTNMIHVYKKRKDGYHLLTENFLLNTMIDGGYRSALTIADADNDGDDDLLYSVETTRESWSLFYYQNTGGTGARASFSAPLDITPTGYGSLFLPVPALADVDGDNTPDLVVGQDDGSLLFYKGNPNSSPLQYNAPVLNWQGIEAEGSSSPTFFDGDADGDLDLLLGQTTGSLSYYLNAGSRTNPSFIQVTDTYGSVRVNLFWRYIYNDEGQIIDSILDQDLSSGYSAPATGDIDGDGTLDLVVGRLKGTPLVYLDFLSTNPLFQPLEENGKFLLSPLGYKDVIGDQSRPALGRLMLGSEDQLLLGNSRGGIQGWSTTELPLDLPSPQPKAQKQVVLYPNPAENMLYLKSLPEKLSEFNIYGTDGRIMLAGSLTGNMVDIHTLKAGIYYIMLKGKAAPQTLPFIKR